MQPRVGRVLAAPLAPPWGAGHRDAAGTDRGTLQHLALGREHGSKPVSPGAAAAGHCPIPRGGQSARLGSAQRGTDHRSRIKQPKYVYLAVNLSLRT